MANNLIENIEENIVISGNDSYSVHEVKISVPNNNDQDQDTDNAEEIREVQLMRNVYQKLDNLPLSFGMPAYSDEIPDNIIRNRFGIDLKDAKRVMKITTLSSIEEDSYDELMIENRMQYFALKRFRMTASAFFKFSTAIDGKTVDKTKIPQFLKDLMDELQEEYEEYSKKHIGRTWTIGHSNLTGRTDE